MSNDEYQQKMFWDKKYYVSTLFEFHIGFEFEYLSIEDKWEKVDLSKWLSPSKDKFVKINIENPNQCSESDLLRNINWWDICIKRNNLIRVKYLDREDIENLGWVFNTENKNFELKTAKKSLRLQWFDNNAYNWLMIVSIHKETNNTLFDGAIKNKSELIKLMEKLNIK